MTTALGVADRLLFTQKDTHKEKLNWQLSGSGENTGQRVALITGKSISALSVLQDAFFFFFSYATSEISRNSSLKCMQYKLHSCRLNPKFW